MVQFTGNHGLQHRRRYQWPVRCRYIRTTAGNGVSTDAVTFEIIEAAEAAASPGRPEPHLTAAGPLAGGCSPPPSSDGWAAAVTAAGLQVMNWTTSCSTQPTSAAAVEAAAEAQAVRVCGSSPWDRMDSSWRRRQWHAARWRWSHRRRCCWEIFCLKSYHSCHLAVPDTCKTLVFVVHTLFMMSLKHKWPNTCCAG